MTSQHVDAPTPSLLASASRLVSAQIKAAMPKITAEQAAAAVALSGNPTGA